MESLDALFGLDLPLPESIVRMHMEGIDNIMHRWGVPQGFGSFVHHLPADMQDQSDAGLRHLQCPIHDVLRPISEAGRCCLVVGQCHVMR
jgi:hypothetical protein